MISRKGASAMSLLVSWLGKEKVWQTYSKSFSWNYCEDDLGHGSEIIPTTGRNKPQGLGKAGPDRSIFETLFTTCSGCDYTKADSCVIKCSEMISLNRLWAAGFFPNDFNGNNTPIAPSGREHKGTRNSHAHSNKAVFTLTIAIDQWIGPRASSLFNPAAWFLTKGGLDMEHLDPDKPHLSTNKENTNLRVLKLTANY